MAQGIKAHPTSPTSGTAYSRAGCGSKDWRYHRKLGNASAAGSKFNQLSAAWLVSLLHWVAVEKLNWVAIMGVYVYRESKILGFPQYSNIE